MLWSFSSVGVVLNSLTVLFTSCGCTQNPWRVLPLLSIGAFFVFSSHDIEPGLFCRSKVALLSSFAVVLYSSGTHPQPLVSGGSKGSFNVRGKKRQCRNSWVTLYELFPTNIVNKTRNAQSWILITCLRLWGRRGDASENGGYLNVSGHVMAQRDEEAICCFQL